MRISWNENELRTIRLEALLMGSIAGNPRIGLGKSRVKGLVNPGYAIVGVILIIVGIMFGCTGVGTDILSKIIGEDRAGGLVMALTLALIFCGLALLASAWAVTMEKVYLRNGVCQIVDGNVRCNGGCTQCVFAARYVQMKNSDTNDRHDD